MTDDRQRTSRRRTLAADERSLSDVLGYILVFSLVLMSVLLVTVGGLSTLENARDTERAQNAERAFDVVADNFASVYERNAPSRATEIDLGEAEMFYDSNVSITVRGDDQELASRELRPVKMGLRDDRSIVYEGGAVFRESGAGLTMVEEPPYLLSTDRVHVPVVQTTSPTVESAGSTTVLLRGVSTERSIAAAGTQDSLAFDELTVEIASPRFEAWETYLANDAGLDCMTEADVETVTCTLDLDSEFTVYVTVQQIEVSLIL